MSVTIIPNPQGGGFLLRCEQWLPAPLEKVFAFFSDANALVSITPPWLNFHVVPPPPIELAAGVLIDYKLRMRGIPLRWRSEITVWEPPDRFIDLQRKGPYKHWEHEHTFRVDDGGTIVTDTIHYSVLGGALVHRLLVKHDLERIFAYRQQVLSQRFEVAQNGAD
jgi:ligand-binding SRPBCC domain-containing protein